jgi:Domain of unknown function (DUF4157)
MGIFTALTPNSKGAPAHAGPAVARLQRACAACNGKDPECESCKQPPLQRRAASSGDAPTVATDGVDFTSGGERVPGGLRSSLEPLFGVRFDAVRLHDNPRSHDLAQRYGARAFTLGQDVHFARNEFQPNSRSGMALLAHELSHTVQQRGAVAPSAATKSVAVDAPSSPLELEADAAAERVLAGRPAGVRSGVLAGSAAGGISRVQRIQRVPAAQTANRVVDDHTRVAVTRTVTEEPCTATARTTSTPRGDIFYVDRESQAVGMRYSHCHGSVRLVTGATISYEELVRSGENLLNTLRTNPAAGANLGGLLTDAINSSHVTASGDVTLTVSGILSAKVSGSATVGPGDQKYNVQGVLTVTPRGVSFRVTGGIDVAQTPLQSTSTYTLEGNATAGFGSVTLGYSQIDTSAVGGTPSSERSLTGTLGIPLPDIGPLSNSSLRAGASVNPDSGAVTPIFSLEGRFGGPSKTERVDCYDCDCPPPRIAYRCTRTVDATSRPVVDVAAGRDHQRLLYAYDSDAPANSAAFGAQVAAMVAQARSGYRIEHITGHASPEASRAYNLSLSLQRANHARQALQAAASAAAAAGPSAAATAAASTAASTANTSLDLPPAVGAGELLGESQAPTGEEASNAALVSELSRKLSPLTEEERLDLLGVDGPARTDPEARRQALADVQAFIDGRDARGRRLGQRARWERIFPFLRRVDVELVRDEKSHLETTPGSTSTTCEPSDVAWAQSAASILSPIPSRDLLPSRRCGR